MANSEEPLKEKASEPAANGLKQTDFVRPPLRTVGSSAASSLQSSRASSVHGSGAGLHRTTITTTHRGAKDESSSSDEGGVSSTTEILHSGSSVTHEVSKDGSLSIRPVAARTRSGTRNGHGKVKIRKVVNFRHRTSAFDRFNTSSQADQFRGFYTLFWIVMAVATARTFQSSYADKGTILGTGFAKLFSEDAKVLVATDAALVASSFLCVPYVKMLKRGWIRYRYTGTIIQHISQGLWLGMWIRWTFFRNWPWVQSGFLVLHALSMLMKIHSYMTVNGDLSVKAIQSRRVLAELERIVAEKGGWDVVVQEASDAKAAAEKEDKAAGVGPAQVNGHAAPEPVRTSQTAKASGADPTRKVQEVDGQIADDAGLHRRKTPAALNTAVATSLATESHKSPTSPRSRARRASLSRLGSGPDAKPALATAEAARLILIADYHPDEAQDSVGDVAREAADLLEELTSTVDGVVRWPENVTFANFWDYLLVPSLVYEIAFPRTQGVRPLYILEKITATLGTFSLIYIVTQSYIWEVMPKPGDSFLSAFGTLVLPFMINYLLIFYIIFECICNAFAEFTRFADREFYSDWWNSTSFDEFSRKWNKPVHNFLLRHVYASTISAYGLSKSQAALVTFFLSALMHELLMAIVTKKLRMYLFAMQMAQLPIIYLGQAKFFKQHPALGNLCFWIGLISGFPLLGVCYILY